jgi:hypothetical protein
MAAFADDERQYLQERRLGRIAKVGKNGTPHVVAVGCGDRQARSVG